MYEFYITEEEFEEMEQAEHDKHDERVHIINLENENAELKEKLKRSLMNG